MVKKDKKKNLLGTKIQGFCDNVYYLMLIIQVFRSGIKLPGFFVMLYFKKKRLGGAFMGRKRMDDIDKSVRFRIYVNKKVLDKLRLNYTDADIRLLVNKFLDDLSKKR